ncbi:MAG: aminopeptidase P family protein [Rhodobacteraceae bacterium]|nr:aminopeptidase P family protein [Paracoccaceae bacterium]
MSGTFAKRLADLRGVMARTGTDLVAIGPSSHMQWLAGLNPHGDERPVMLLVSAGYAGLLMPALNAASCRQHTDLPFHEWRDAEGPEAALAGLLTACGAEGPGLSVVLDETMRADFALRLLGAMKAPGHRFTGDTVGALRAVKDDEEYRLLKASALLNDAAIAAGFDALVEGMRERDVAEVILGHYAAHGAEPGFCAVAFGGNGAFPHHHTGDTVLTREMAVQIDAGCRLGGYPSDMTRCGWFGTPPGDYLRVADVVERAVRAALGAARPGVTGADVDRAARAVIEEAGYGDHFPHRTGHGLGIDIHEPPYIAATNPAPLAEGNVFSIEPGIYFAGRYGIRLEDIVILRADGPEILSAMPRDIVIRG